MVKKVMVLLTLVMVLALLACGPAAPEPTPEPAPGPAPLPGPTPAPAPTVPPEKAGLTPSPAEASLPQYGSILRFGLQIPRSFDAHQKMAYAPIGTLPTFNLLVMFDLAYQETVPDNLIGDLAESWEESSDGTEITFRLHQGVKWHDGMPFTADDVVYSLDKMTDVTRSAIADWFPAYERAEKIDDHTVKVHLKYPSAGFMIALAADSYAQIQAKHLAGTDDQSGDFLVGTGPFVFEDYKIRVHLKWKRNPDYFKKDQYGNQLPYLDGIHLFQAANANTNDMLIGRRLDLKNPTTGAATVESYNLLAEGAPELLYQKRSKDVGAAIYLNLNHKPLDDIRVRRALGLLVDEESLIIGYSGDPMFGITDIGLLTRSFGLPKAEVIKLMGWDKPWEERVAEAKKLLAEAGYPDGFKLNMMSTGYSMSYTGSNLVFADTLRKNLNIDAEVNGLAATERDKRLEEDDYDVYTESLRVGQDPIQLKIYFGTDGFANWTHYSSPEFDRMIDELDRIINPQKRREVIWDIERLLLADLPALPTGCFIANFMPYYPHVKNLRWTDMSYSNVCRFEDVWIDESLRVQ